MTNINDVAKRCGVAKSTVSNALTGKKYVSPELKQKVLEVCKELDFVPDFYASSRASANNIVALVLEEDSNVKFRGFYSDLVMACLKTAAAADKHLLVYNGLDKKSVLTMLKRNKAPVDGAIVMTPLVDDERIAQIERQRIPCVIIGRPAQKLDIGYVDINNTRMVSDVVHMLYEQGWREFCLINSEKEKTISLDRAEGFSGALARYSDVERGMLYIENASEAEGHRLALPLVRKGKAFIAADGLVARGIYSAVLEKGLEPGRDVKIYSLGEDDPENAKWEFARQDYKKLGETAMKMLLSEIEEEKDAEQMVIDAYSL